MKEKEIKCIYCGELLTIEKDTISESEGNSKKPTMIKSIKSEKLKCRCENCNYDIDISITKREEIPQRTLKFIGA